MILDTLGRCLQRRIGSCLHFQRFDCLLVISAATRRVVVLVLLRHGCLSEIPILCGWYREGSSFGRALGVSFQGESCVPQERGFVIEAPCIGICAAQQVVVWWILISFLGHLAFLLTFQDFF